MQVFWHERLQRDACSALLYHTATPSNSKFWLSKSSQSLPHDICGEDSFSEMLDFIGAPGEIRTPDPQIRSLGDNCGCPRLRMPLVRFRCDHATCGICLK